MPLAIAFLAVSLAGLRLRLPGSGWPGFFFSLAILGAAAAVAGFVLRRRGIAVLGALCLVGVCFGDTQRHTGFEAGFYVASSPLESSGTGVALLGSSLGGALVLLLAAWSIDGGRPRRLARDLAWTAAVCLAAGFVPWQVTVGTVTLDQGGVFGLVFAVAAAGFGLHHGRLVTALAVLVVCPMGVAVLLTLSGVAGSPLIFGVWAAIPVVAWLLARGRTVDSGSVERQTP